MGKNFMDLIIMIVSDYYAFVNIYLYFK